MCQGMTLCWGRPAANDRTATRQTLSPQSGSKPPPPIPPSHFQNTAIHANLRADDHHRRKSIDGLNHHRRKLGALLKTSLMMRLSPPELSYLYTSLTADPPLRPDLRALTTYRPRSLQTDFLCTANGSARITWVGGDVLVVVKAQIGQAVELAPGIFGGQVFVDVYQSLLSLVWPH